MNRKKIRTVIIFYILSLLVFFQNCGSSPSALTLLQKEIIQEDTNTNTNTNPQFVNAKNQALHLSSIFKKQGLAGASTEESYFKIKSANVADVQHLQLAAYAIRSRINLLWANNSAKKSSHNEFFLLEQDKLIIEDQVLKLVNTLLTFELHASEAGNIRTQRDRHAGYFSTNYRNVRGFPWYGPNFYTILQPHGSSWPHYNLDSNLSAAISTPPPFYVPAYETANILHAILEASNYFVVCSDRYDTNNPSSIRPTVDKVRTVAKDVLDYWNSSVLYKSMGELNGWCYHEICEVKTHNGVTYDDVDFISSSNSMFAMANYSFYVLNRTLGFDNGESYRNIALTAERNVRLSFSDYSFVDGEGYFISRGVKSNLSNNTWVSIATDVAHAGESIGILAFLIANDDSESSTTAEHLNQIIQTFKSGVMCGQNESINWLVDGSKPTQPIDPQTNKTVMTYPDCTISNSPSDLSKSQAYYIGEWSTLLPALVKKNKVQAKDLINRFRLATRSAKDKSNASGNYYMLLMDSYILRSEVSLDLF